MTEQAQVHTAKTRKPKVQTETITKESAKQKNDKVLAFLKKRKVGEYPLTIGFDENDDPIILEIRHRRMSPQYFIEEKQVPTLLSNMFGAEFKEEDPKAFADKKSTTTDIENIQDTLEKLDVIKELQKVTDLFTDIFLDSVEGVENDYAFVRGEANYENGEISTGDLGFDELQEFVMYQFEGAFQAVIKLKGGGQTSVSSLGSFPQSE